MYILEGLPGNAYAYDDTATFKDYTLFHSNDTLGFCELHIIDDEFLVMKRYKSQTGEVHDEFCLSKRQADSAGGSSHKLMLVILVIASLGLVCFYAVW